tara:strand:+ start:280 stop:759 length:480 start_codon:yes stop_codon:yes gene_type:complete
MKLINISLPLFLIAFSSCGDDHDHSEHSENPNEEACEHMKDGPNKLFDAGADPASATDTSASDWKHTRVDLTLSANGDSFVGFVKYEASEAGDYLIFTSTEATLKVAETDAESSQSVTDCSEVTHVQTFELEIGEQVIEISTSSPSLSLVVEQSQSDTH